MRPVSYDDRPASGPAQSPPGNWYWSSMAHFGDRRTTLRAAVSALIHLPQSANQQVAALLHLLRLNLVLSQVDGVLSRLYTRDISGGFDTGTLTAAPSGLYGRPERQSDRGQAYSAAPCQVRRSVSAGLTLCLRGRMHE